MTLIDDLLSASASAPPPRLVEVRPKLKLAILTCMDSRIDVFKVFGLRLGDAHIIRNAGGRVTDDMLRSLALSSGTLGIDTVVVMQHTLCGLENTSDDELRVRTGADLSFLPIDDHVASVRGDVDRLAATPYLSRIHTIAGLVYDVESGRVDDVARWVRSS